MTNCLRFFTFIMIITVLLIPLSSCRPEPIAPDDARIIILQPSAEAVLPSGQLTVRTFVEYFTLVDKTGQANHSGEGHLIFYIDVTPPLVKGESALTAKGTCFVSAEKTYTWENVSPGQHSFWVQLVNNDNTVLEPPVAVRVPVTTVSN